MSSGNLFAQLPILDGSNWLAWSVDMKGWLQKEELWGFVAGAVTEPSPLADSATILEKAQNWEQQNKWKLADAAAVGSMSLKLCKDIKLLYQKDEDTSAELWKKLKEAFGKVSFVNRALWNHKTSNTWLFGVTKCQGESLLYLWLFPKHCQHWSMLLYVNSVLCIYFNASTTMRIRCNPI